MDYEDTTEKCKVFKTKLLLAFSSNSKYIATKNGIVLMARMAWYAFRIK